MYDLGLFVKNFLLRTRDLKFISLLLSLIFSICFASILILSDSLNLTTWLGWLLGIGVVGIMHLHIKSFFSVEVSDLGFYYSRLYGMYFAFICTSLVFIIILSFNTKNLSSLSGFIMLCVVFCSGFFNFLRDNFADQQRKHLLAKDLIEKNNKKNNN